MPKKLTDKSYVYLLKCVDDTLYCGYTNNLQSRLKTHNSGKGAKYTKSRLPVQIVYSETFDSKSDALKRECEIKKLSRTEKLKLIGEYVK
ncbi:MAG: GIY-YIG nuclease family protein [Clostridia bacterium]